MKKKELMQIASQIIEAEKIINTSTDKEKVKSAKQKIYSLSSRIHSLEDMCEIDEIIQKSFQNS